MRFEDVAEELGFEPMRWKRVKKTALWAVFSVSGEAL